MITKNQAIKAVRDSLRREGILVSARAEAVNAIKEIPDTEAVPRNGFALVVLCCEDAGQGVFYGFKTEAEAYRYGARLLYDSGIDREYMDDKTAVKTFAEGLGPVSYFHVVPATFGPARQKSETPAEEPIEVKNLKGNVSREAVIEAVSQWAETVSPEHPIDDLLTTIVNLPDTTWRAFEKGPLDPPQIPDEKILEANESFNVPPDATLSDVDTSPPIVKAFNSCSYALWGLSPKEQSRAVHAVATLLGLRSIK